jgi:hypothetical protein
MLKKQKVSCGGCHYELVQASGRASYEAYFEGGVLKTAIVLGAGYIKKENCLACHDQAKAIKEVENKKLMHEKHVTVKTARCFDCHQPITHKKAELKQPVQAKAGKEKSVGEKIMSAGSAGGFEAKRGPRYARFSFHCPGQLYGLPHGGGNHGEGREDLEGLSQGLY